MALIRTLLITTFDQIDTDEEKNTMKELYESQGYRLIAETKLQEPDWSRNGSSHRRSVMGSLWTIAERNRSIQR